MDQQPTFVEGDVIEAIYTTNGKKLAPGKWEMDPVTKSFIGYDPKAPSLLYIVPVGQVSCILIRRANEHNQETLETVSKPGVSGEA